MTTHAFIIYYWSKTFKASIETKELYLHVHRIASAKTPNDVPRSDGLHINHLTLLPKLILEEINMKSWAVWMQRKRRENGGGENCPQFNFELHSFSICFLYLFSAHPKRSLKRPLTSHIREISFDNGALQNSNHMQEFEKSNLAQANQNGRVSKIE